MVSDREGRQYDLLRMVSRYCRDGSISLSQLAGRLEELWYQCEELPDCRRRELHEIWTEFEILNAVSIDGTPLSEIDGATLEHTKQRLYQWIDKLPVSTLDDFT